MSALHSAQTVANGIHIIHALEYADAAARAGATGLTAADVGKVARQQNDNTFWLLTDHSPVSWTQLGSLAVTSVPVGRTVWVDSTNGTPTGSPGDIATSFDTVAGAIAAASSLSPTSTSPVLVLLVPGTYQEDPLTIPSYVTVTGLDGRDTAIIEANTTTSALITCSDQGVIKGLTVRGASGAGGIGVYCPGSASSRLKSVVVRDCTTGVVCATGSTVFIEDIFIRRLPGETLVTGVLVNSGAIGRIFRLSIEGAPTASISQGLVTDNGLYYASEIDCFFCDTAYVIKNGGTAFIRDGSTNFADVGIHIESTGGSLGLVVFATVDSLTWDILAESAASIIQSDAYRLESQKVSLVEGIVWTGSWQNFETGDPGLRVEGELHVGSYTRPAESVFGGGDSHTFGLVAQTNSNGEAGAWVDITEQIASFEGSTVNLFPGITVGSTFYIGGDVEFPGLKINAPTPLVIGSGAVAVEYWNGSAWVALEWMTTDADAPYDSYGNDLVNSTSPVQMRFGLMPGWATKELNSITKYWVRFRVTSLITASAVIEQMKLHTDRTEINADGFVEFFGAARKLRTIDINTNTLRPAGTSPGNQDIAYGANLIIGHEENSYANNASQQSGLSLQLPTDTDTSFPLILEIEWQPSTGDSGDVEWEVFYVTHPPDETLAVSTPGPLSESVTAQVNAAPGVAYKGAISTHLLSISDAVVTRGDSIAFMVRRDATGGNPDDTYTGAAVIRNLRLSRTVWHP